MDWDEIQRVMVVVAHPDDAEFGCAGTVAKLTRDGKEVVYVLTTDGSKGSSDHEMTPERLTVLRQGEQQDAATVLGVSQVTFLGFPDGMLTPSLELRKAISAEIRRHRPDVLICQSPTRDLAMRISVAHPDHLATGEATLAAVYPCARDRMTFPELLDAGLEPWAVKELWINATSVADHFIDISETLETKIQALLAHASQVKETVREWMPERAKQVGEPQGMAYAEAFRRVELP